jgi:hypothetical protein
LVKYVVSAQVGGKLAQIGGRMIEGTTKKVAKEFFERFSGILSVEEGSIACRLPTLRRSGSSQGHTVP